MMLQDFIHKITEGGGARVIKWFAAGVAVVTLAVWYDLAQFRNFSAQEAMDAAQLARRLSDGQGYTTDFVRPFSMYLIRQHRDDGDPLVRDAHPDLANPPVYPVVLAGVLKWMPFPNPDPVTAKSSPVYRPDVWIGVFNQVLFLLAAVLLFRLARRLFDDSVAWGSVLVFLGAELFWRFSVAGQSTMLLVVLTLALAAVLARLDEEAQRPIERKAWCIGLAAVAGLLTGLSCLTRYSFGLLTLPVLLYLAILPSQRRTVWVVAALAAFCVVVAPWIVRNITISGTPFGTAGYAVIQDTPSFPGNQLERTLRPDFGEFTPGDLTRKLTTNLREMVRSDLPTLGGSWVTALFLVGLLMPFRSLTLGRLRVFLVAGLIVMALAQALGRTHLSADSPELNSENLLVVLAPLVFMFGVSLFFVLLEQLALSMQGRIWLKILASVVVCAPLLLSLFSPKGTAAAYPPYLPRWLHDQSRWFRPGEWIMSDIPWAVAWYGGRQSVWTSVKYRTPEKERSGNDFFAIHRIKPVNGLHFSVKALKALDAQPLWDWVNRTSERPWEDLVTEWEGFILAGVLLQREVPEGFPIKRAPYGLLPEIFLTDSERNPPESIK
jgi:hypothetical protein